MPALHYKLEPNKLCPNCNTNPMKTNIRLLIVSGLAVSALSAQAALTTLDSSGFASQYNGNDIFDGTNAANGWVAAGGATDDNLTLNGSNVISTLTATNGWIQHDNDSTPWENGSGSWTVEVRANISASAGSGGFVIWGALNGERDIMTIRENQVTNLAGTVYSTETNAGGFHDFRLTYDASDDTYHYFRDGLQITPDGGIGQQGGTGSTRLIVGDCCTNVGGSTLGGPGSSVEFEYIRYDNSGAFSPAGVPEPSTALLGLAGFAFFLRRRR